MPSITIGAVGAAFIGAAISLLSLIISKENKTSEFRQAWIDALRSEIAEAISAVATLEMMLGNPDQENTVHFIETWSRATSSLARVELRLNVLEQDHKDLEQLIRKTEDMLRQTEAGQYDPREAESLQDQVVAQSKIILKREWDRVRNGEPTFQIAKGITLIALILLGFYWLYQFSL